MVARLVVRVGPARRVELGAADAHPPTLRRGTDSRRRGSRRRTASRGARKDGVAEERLPEAAADAAERRPGPQAGAGGQGLAAVKKKIVEANTERSWWKPSEGEWRCCPGSWTGT